MNVSPDELQLNGKYRITSVNRIETKDFGAKIVATIMVNDKLRDIFLPGRFTALTDSDVSSLNDEFQTNNRFLVFLGKSGKSHRYDLE